MRLLFLFLIVCIVSCKPSDKVEEQEVKKPALSVVKNHKKPITIHPNFDGKLENWNEYNTLADYIVRFRKISPNEAMSNANELNGLIQKVHDSIRPEFLKTDAFRARANVLLNESLRFSDMATISSISAEEINSQIVKVIEAYSSLNAKINMTLSRQELEKEIESGKHSVLLKENLPAPKKEDRLELSNLKQVKDVSLKKKN